MLTVNEVSKLTGVSVRTLHYYDETGLLKPAKVTQAGYRLYGEKELERLEEILLFRELEFSLKDIASILSSPQYDRIEALRQQKELLLLKKEHIEKLIIFTEKAIENGGNNMSFEAFDKQKLKEYEEQAKARWGGTDAYREYEAKSAAYPEAVQNELAEGLMNIFREFGAIKNKAPDSNEAQALVQKLQMYITQNYYTCTRQILSGLGAMYSAGGEMTENIDRAGGAGTAEFVSKAIKEY